MNNTVKIEHKIDSTSKEIYEFEKVGNGYVYVGIMYSHRDGVGDMWGEEWRSEKDYEKALDDYAKSQGYKDYDNMEDHYEYIVESHHAPEISDIDDRFNPVCNKTKHGEIRYSGCYWGYGDHEEKYTPKISEAEIKLKILEKTRKIKVDLGTVK
jgi:hypothetical protein